MTKYDVLAFGVHPDDLEIGIFGTLVKSIREGKRVLLIDLTQGEMGSNGNSEIREREAQEAAKLIGADRICLKIPDRGIRVEKDQLDLVVGCLRKFQPNWVLYPYYKDYHPDHENGSRLIREAILSSGLNNYQIIGQSEEAYRPKQQALYYINEVENQNLYVDISDVIELKRQALEKHESQFMKKEGSHDTYLNNGFVDQLIARDAYMGMRCKVHYAEAIHLITPPVVTSLGGQLK
jgi:bacillithiol biosynthesis deacetylase BshB1